MLYTSPGLGINTANRACQGYKTASANERALDRGHELPEPLKKSAHLLPPKWQDYLPTMAQPGSTIRQLQQRSRGAQSSKGAKIIPQA
jgi:hypothetical protein